MTAWTFCGLCSVDTLLGGKHSLPKPSQVCSRLKAELQSLGSPAGEENLTGQLVQGLPILSIRAPKHAYEKCRCSGAAPGSSDPGDVGWGVGV